METVASKLLMVRFVPDYAYIQTDPEKKAEAEAAALTLCTVIGLPELAEGAAQGILLAWAYGEAIMDIRTLVSGGQTFFRADACISRVEFHSTCNLRRGIMYDFPTYFGYN